MTRVDYEHRGLEAHGDKARTVADRVGSPGGWLAILQSLADLLER